MIEPRVTLEDDPAPVLASLLAIPAELRTIPNWVCWCSEIRDGKPTKVPYQAGKPWGASATDSTHWTTFENAVAAMPGYDGVGWVTTKDTGIVLIDLDDAGTSALAPWAQGIVKRVPSYAERSPSGLGIHIIAKATLPDGARKRGCLEMYDAGRFFTFTGAQVSGTPATIESADVRWLHRLMEANVFNFEIKPELGQLMNGQWEGTYSSQSEADLALCSILAWLKLDEPEIDLAFRLSGLFREKWDEKHGDQSYGQKTIAKALESHTSSVASVQEDAWPELQPLPAALLPVDRFNIEFLPETLRPLVADVSERMQTPTDFAGVTATVALAGVVNRRAIMFPKQQDHGWVLPLNLWGGIISGPGCLKSPLIETILKPLTAIEASWREEFATSLSIYETAHEREELVRQARRDEFKRAVKQSDHAVFDLGEESQPPFQKRLLATDATFESLHVLLANNPAGIFVTRDELSGWMGDLSKHGRESERAFYLESWGGCGGFTVDRVGRGSIHVPHVCTSLLGSLQPARVRQYLSDTIADSSNSGNDGLFQRFQMLVWPDLSSDWTLVDRPPDATALTTVERIFSRLAYLPAEAIRLGFGPEAQEYFVAWWTALEKVIRTADWSPAMIAHLSKYRSLVPKLAALFELADAAAHHNFDPGQGVMLVSLSHAEQAVRYVDYLWSHAKRIYGCITATEITAGRELAKRISSGKLPARFTIRELYRHGWHRLDDPEKARTALQYLADLGWVREKRADREKGRPSELFEVNPSCPKNGGAE